jgi:lipopolysaccharide export system protein LptA
VSEFLAPPADRRQPRPERAASWITSDRIVDRLFEGESVSFLYGNVYLDRDSVVVRADSAWVYRDRRFVRLFSNVRARSAGSRLASREADYDRGSGDADFRTEVRVWEDDVLATANLGELRDAGQMLRLIENAVLIAPEFTVRADTLVRDRREDFGEAFGDVRIVDPGAATLVTGRHARYADDGSWARVDLEPALVTREEGGTPIRSVARDMQFFRTEERVVMTDSVQIRQGLTLATADTAVVFGRERMLLTGRPEVSLGNDSRMRGDRISFFYSDGKLTRVILLGSARMEDTGPDSLAALYTGLPDLEVIEGDSIAVDFADGEIYRTTVVGSGQSVYVPLDVEDEVAFNEVTGDTIVLDFEAGKVRRVDVRGSMRGTYHFARLSELRGRTQADSAATDSLRTAGADSLAAVVDTLAAAADTLAVAPFDSLAAAADDSLVAGAAGAAGPPWDFTKHAETVDYNGHAVRFDLQNMSIAINQNGELRYGTMKLTADEIQLDTRTRELYARGNPMLQDKETIVGERLGYDFGNRTGAVRDGVTTFDGYYYVGDEIHRYPDGSVKIASGKMTSCDLAEPHYHFWSDRMKLRLGDQVVAAPIVLRVGHVPVFALPFYFKSLEAGRRSGILFPNFNFGWSSREGRYIRDFGYYWATNDYTDLIFEADYNERREFAWRVFNRYVKRYAFDGSAGYSRRQTFGDQPGLKEWRLNWSHNQPKLFDEYPFRASVDMASKTLSRSDLNANVGRDVVDSELKSTAYISRNFGLVNASVNLERTEQTNATDDDPTTNNVLYQMTLPSLSLSVRQITLAPALKPGQRGGFLGNLARNTYFSQGYSARHNSSKRETTQQKTYAARGNWGLSVRPPRLGPFNPSFGTSGSLAWQRDELTGDLYMRQIFPEIPDTLEYYAPLDSVLEKSDPTLSFNAGATTTLYGVFPVRVGPLRAIRHTFNLGASMSYRPRLGDKQLPGESYGFNVGNRFDAKYATAQAVGDSAETLKKLDGFLDWTMSTGYSPRAPRGQQWNTISSNVTVRPGQNRNLSIKMTNSIDPYALAITQTSLSYGYGFQGRLDTGWRGEVRETKRSAQIDRLGAAGGDSLAAMADSLARAEADSLADPFGEAAGAGFYGDLGSAFDDQSNEGPSRDLTEGGRFLPWALSGSISYNRNNRQDTSTARAGVTLTTNLTRDWQFMYTTSVDLGARAMTRQEYRLQRDLHCWRLEFNRIVSAVDSQFGFRLYLKAIPELKLTQGKEDLMGSAGGLAGDAVFGGL